MNGRSVEESYFFFGKEWGNPVALFAFTRPFDEHMRRTVGEGYFSWSGSRCVVEAANGGLA